MSKKMPLWLTYTDSIQIKGKQVKIAFKSDSVELPFSSIHSIMFYGSVCDLSQEFLEKCSGYGIPIIIHRRNLSKAVWITPSTTSNHEDLLTKQIVYRENKKKTAYISKRLLKAKFQSMSWLIPPPYHNLHRVTSLTELRSIEAWHAKQYWGEYYSQLGFSGTTRRQKNNPVTLSLDAASKFISGILLRWIHFHHLSPFHGFTHTPSNYPSLVYDLMEPYRGYIDKVVFRTLQNDREYGSGDSKTLLPKVFADIKSALDSQIYVHSTRQIVTFHELYHGLVLALRAYLLGNPRFVVPLPDQPKGGRPINAGYSLYGKPAGIMNFWVTAKKIANDSQLSSSSTSADSFKDNHDFYIESTNLE